MAFIDARSLPAGSQISADIVVIGGGMAGIAMARQWAGGRLKIAVLESGDRQFSNKIQDLYAGSGVVRGPGNPDKPFDDYLTSSRRRQLGGSGNVWGGKCAPIDVADFAKRSWVKDSGWPLDRTVLQPYFDRACDLLEIPHFAPPNADPSQPGRAAVSIDDGRAVISVPRYFSKFSGGFDTKAFDRFRTEFADQPNISVYLNANVVDIRLQPGGGEVAELAVQVLGGARHTAKGRAYVLAVGGIENARLLLASNGVEAKGVGNRHDLVGRYFQGHVTYGVDTTATEPGSALVISDPDRDMALYTDNRRDRMHCVLATSLAAQQRLKSGNFTVTLQSLRAGVADPTTVAVRQLAGALTGPGKSGRLLGCYFMAEHLPNPDSRITLGDTKDALDMPRVKLDWRYSEADWRSLERSVDAVAQALGAAGLGRLCWPAEQEQFLALTSASRHHMGTTRMHADRRKGVVDTDSRVWGVGNLYVAGSSVFPTSGLANPTLTLLALAMRLSDHLTKTVGAA